MNLGFLSLAYILIAISMLIYNVSRVACFWVDNPYINIELGGMLSLDTFGFSLLQRPCFSKSIVKIKKTV